MNKIKQKQLLRLASRLEEMTKELPETSYKLTAKSLQSDIMLLLLGAANVPHKGPAVLRYAKPSVVSAILKVQDRIGAEKMAMIGGIVVPYWVKVREENMDFAFLVENISEVKKIYPDGNDLPLMYRVNVDGVDVDFMYDDFPWSREALLTAVQSPLLGTSDVRVARPEYLLLYKFKTAATRDVEQIKALLTLDGVTDLSRKLVRQYLPEDIEDFEALVMEAEFGIF